MKGRRVSPARDTWGRTPDDPFLRKLLEDPKRAARISMAFTIGMILFWIFFVAGMIFVVAYMVFG